jgi:hypothetical protein
MKRANVLQDVRQMRIEELYARRQQRTVTMTKAAEILGVTERTFRRWGVCYDAEGAGSAARTPIKEVPLAAYRPVYGVGDRTGRRLHPMGRHEPRRYPVCAKPVGCGQRLDRPRSPPAPTDPTGPTPVP